MSQFPFGSSPPQDPQRRDDDAWAVESPEPAADAEIGRHAQLAEGDTASSEVAGDERWSAVGDPVQTYSESGSTSDAAREEGARTKDEAVRATKDVASTAKDQASHVAAEVRDQAEDLTSRVTGEVRTQGREQQQRLAGGLHSAADELSEMAHSSEHSGIASEVAQEVSRQLGRTAGWLEDREPADIVDDVRRFARREPALFLIGAATAGFVVGRLVRSFAANKKDESNETPALTSRPQAADQVGPAPGRAGVDSGAGWGDATSGEALR